MKQFWMEAERCTACGACVNACPNGSITLTPDDCGFCYPTISSTCIDCDACEKACKGRENEEYLGTAEPEVFAAWTRDDDLRFSSTSGGAFTELARVVINAGGIVFGAGYDENNMIVHTSASNEAELSALRQSKYAQSDVGLSFREVRSQLKTGREVLFVGCPCQVAGLKSYLRKDYENLFTVDFICRGVNSPKAYRAWLDEVEQKHQSKATRVWFKYKSGGWKKSPRCTRVDFEDGSHEVFDQQENDYMSGYLGPNLYIRPSCAQCEFQGVPRTSDVTLADFWGLEKTLDDDHGASLILVNSSKGEHLIDGARASMIWHSREFDELLQGNVCFGSSVKINAKSAQFLRALDEMSFSQAIKRYVDNPIKKRIKRFAKRLLGRS